MEKSAARWDYTTRVIIFFMLGFDLPFFLIANLIALFIALPVHEFAHAWTADHLGDDTPASMVA